MINSNVVESYAWLATRHLAPMRRAQLAVAADRRGAEAARRSTAGTAATSSAPSTVATRAPPSNRSARTPGSCSATCCSTRSFPEAIARVRAHRALGHKTLLITGALDFVVAPLEPLFDEIVCARLGEVDGRFTGEMVETPPTGEARAMLMESWAASFGLALGATVAYADSTSDLPMLEAAGHPGRRQPRAEARGDRATARLADRELVEGEGRAAEHRSRSRRGAPARGHRRRL